MTAFIVACATMIVGGMIWYWRSPVSAGRPASLLVVMGALGIVGALLCGCDQGPTEQDMAGCTVRGGGPPITSREVAECAIERKGG